MHFKVEKVRGDRKTFNKPLVYKITGFKNRDNNDLIIQIKIPQWIKFSCTAFLNWNIVNK